MKIAIHHSEGHFSTRWMEYCLKNEIDYKIVNAYSSNIIAQIIDCDIFMWHHDGYYHQDILAAKNILFALEHAGKKVFPDFNTGWHFDDKVAQKYLLEAIGAPLIPSYVFYDKKTAIEWVNQTTFPKVFKLKGGSGSSNVKLVRNKNAAIKYIRKSFNKGFSPFNRFGHLKERYRKYKLGKDTLLGVVKGIGRIFIPTVYAKMVSREKGYVYFQEFIPNNHFDIRVIVIGDKAFAIKRMVRENDFRASGSGSIIYDKDEIDERCIEISFDINKKIKSQSIAYDFVFDKNNNPLIAEVSYGYRVNLYDSCPGYWSSDLKWHEGKFNPQVWMVEQMIK